MEGSTALAPCPQASPGEEQMLSKPLPRLLPVIAAQKQSQTVEKVNDTMSGKIYFQKQAVFWQPFKNSLTFCLTCDRKLLPSPLPGPMHLRGSCCSKGT